jgi:predicted membrane-bound spermidine synthase
VGGNGEAFDFVVVDFPDPSNFALGKRYSTAFYRLLEKRLSAKGRIVVQATSPLYARKSFWSIVATLEAAGFKVAPYHALGRAPCSCCRGWSCGAARLRRAIAREPCAPG